MRGLGVARGFDKSRTHGWFVSVAQPDGRRPKAYYPSEKARDKAFFAKLAEVRAGGVEAAKPIGTADRQALEEMIRLAEPTGLTVLEIFRQGLARATGPTAGLTVGQAAAKFLSEQKGRMDDGRISRVREKELRGKVGRFAGALGAMRVADCGRQAIKTYLAAIPGEPQTRVNHARSVSAFFNWCVAEGFAERNPVPKQEGIQRIPTTFTNEQVTRLFDKALELVPEMFPVLAVQWLAGLRPGASNHLTWEDVDFDRGRILIQPHGNKLRQPDIVRDIPPAVFAALLPFRSQGLLCPANHRKMARALHGAVGFDGDWPADVARHTFASNLFALYDQDSRRVEAVLLHSSGEMLRKHYLLKNVPKEAAEAYFSRYLPSA